MIQSKNCFKISIILILILVYACKESRREAEISKIDVNIPVKRFERELFTIDTTHWLEGIQSLRQRDSMMYEAYVEYLWPIGPAHSSKTAEKLKIFIKDKYWQELYRDVQKKFDDPAINKLKASLDNDFRHYKYYFPKDTIPEVYTVVKGFDPEKPRPTVFTYENILGISLEMFMGADYKYYVGWPIYGEYQIRRFTPEFIEPQCLKVWFSKKYSSETLTDNTLLSQMIYAGKQLYFTDLMSPDMPDTLKIEYTGAQVKWSKENEGEMWRFFAKNNLFYSTNQKDNSRFLSDAPFTSYEGVPAESSPRLGEYMGWQIVKSYMTNNPSVTLENLFADKDYKKIFNESSYRPK